MLPWLQIIDTIVDLTSLARGRSRAQAEPPASLAQNTTASAGLETRLAGVVVAALKEAFDRDSRRLELEREQMEVERRRAERALKLELWRQAGDREIGRLRLVAGVAVATWIGTLFSARLESLDAAARVLLGGGWLCLLLALALAFVGQSRVSAALARLEGDASGSPDISSGPAGSAAPWLIVSGLALVGVGLMS